MKKNLFIVFAGLMVSFFFSCEGKKDFTSLINTRLNALNTHDTVAFKTLYLENAIGESPNWGEPAKGASQITHQYARNFISVADLNFQIHQVNIGNHSATVEMTMAGTMTKLENNVPAYMAGKKYSLKMCTILEFEGGKIKREANYFDQVDFLRQMGFFEQNQN
jgi:steroid delta-isomerase-like uncharacterized protein